MKQDLDALAKEIHKFTRHMNLTIAPLESDLNFAGVQWERDKTNQFWRRTVIRCLFAVTEAVLWNMKAITPQVANVSGIPLTSDELEVAKEVRIVVENGNPKSKPKFLRFPDSVKATFRLFAKVHGVSSLPNFDKGFEALCQTYNLRSRLMHPKGPYDPQVSDSDIATAQQSSLWFQRAYQQLMNDCADAIPKLTGIKNP